MTSLFDASTHAWAPLVPELNVTDIQASLHFWRDLLGFRVLFDRLEKRFAYLHREGAEVMLEELAADSWRTAQIEKPFGRGINLQIGASSLAPLLESLDRARWPLYEPPKERWYRTAATECGQRQFLVQDPDGYLLRFAEDLGVRAVER